MNLDEALSLAIEGERITAPHMQVGCYVDYPTPFNGWYRNWPNGDRCSFVQNADDESAEWSVYVPPVVVKDAWGRPNNAKYVAAVDALIGVKSFAVDPTLPPQLVPPKSKGEPGGIVGKVSPTPAIDAKVSLDKWGRPAT